MVDLEIRERTPVDSGSLTNALLAFEQNLLLHRTIVFGIWPLAGAPLCGPFYEQCYLVAPFTLMPIGGSMLLIGTDVELPGTCVILAAAL